MTSGYERLIGSDDEVGDCIGEREVNGDVEHRGRHPVIIQCKE